MFRLPILGLVVACHLAQPMFHGKRVVDRIVTAIVGLSFASANNRCKNKYTHISAYISQVQQGCE